MSYQVHFYQLTYLAQGILWSRRQFPQVETCGFALCQVETSDFPKRGKLRCKIIVSGGLRSRIDPRLQNNKLHLTKLAKSIYINVSP